MKYIFSILFLTGQVAFAQTYTNGLPLPGLPVSLGPKPMAGSTSVTIATDQGPIPVSFTPSSSQVVTQGTIPWLVDGTIKITNTPTVNVTGGSVTITGTPSVMITGTVSTTTAPNSNASESTVTVTVAESNVAAPANAVGVLVEAESGNATNVRWGASNSAANILSATVGLLLEPGRDSGFMPLGQGTFVHLISVGAGTNKAGIQWVMSQ